MCAMSDGCLDCARNVERARRENDGDKAMRTSKYQFNTVLSKSVRRGLLDRGDFERLSDGMESIHRLPLGSLCVAPRELILTVSH